MTDDIVTALRIVADRFSDKLGPKNLMSEAADEIEKLREQLRLTNIDAFNAAAELDTLRAERDEARQEICQNEADELSMELGGEAIFAWWCAKKRGWDCFKEVEARYSNYRGILGNSNVKEDKGKEAQ